uniref:Uncharacterized protein n=1 Tax=Helianthus annuus TaxID=4232 RepID=A0A251UWL4_HELAN
MIGHQSLEDLKTKDRRSSRRVYTFRRTRQNQRQSYSQGGVCWCTCVCTLSVFGLM